MSRTRGETDMSSKEIRGIVMGAAAGVLAMLAYDWIKERVQR